MTVVFVSNKGHGMVALFETYRTTVSEIISHMQLLEQCAAGLSGAVICVSAAMKRRTKFCRIAEVTL